MLKALSMFVQREALLCQPQPCGRNHRVLSLHLLLPRPLHQPRSSSADSCGLPLCGCAMMSSILTSVLGSRLVSGALVAWVLVCATWLALLGPSWAGDVITSDVALPGIMVVGSFLAGYVTLDVQAHIVIRGDVPCLFWCSRRRRRCEQLYSRLGSVCVWAWPFSVLRLLAAALCRFLSLRWSNPAPLPRPVTLQLRSRCALCVAQREYVT